MGAGANDRCGQCHLSLKWVWRGCDTPNPAISRRSKPVRLFVRAGPPLNTVVALLLAVGLRGPQETVIHIARIDVGSGDRAGGIDGYRGGALAGTCTRTRNIERRDSAVRVCERQISQRPGQDETAGFHNLRTDRTMKNIVSIVEERQFITKEFADTLAGKTPAPYLRVHDSAQIGTFRSLFPHFRFFITPALT